jgi:hypothetical protein
MMMMSSHTPGLGPLRLCVLWDFVNEGRAENAIRITEDDYPAELRTKPSRQEWCATLHRSSPCLTRPKFLEISSKMCARWQR